MLTKRWKLNFCHKALFKMVKRVDNKEDSRKKISNALYHIKNMIF